jgi:hypothetical protein
MKKCPICGKENADINRFCDDCGAVLPEMVMEAEALRGEKQRSRREKAKKPEKPERPEKPEKKGKRKNRTKADRSHSPWSMPMILTALGLTGVVMTVLSLFLNFATIDFSVDLSYGETILTEMVEEGEESEDDTSDEYQTVIRYGMSLAEIIATGCWTTLYDEEITLENRDEILEEIDEEEYEVTNMFDEVFKEKLGIAFNPEVFEGIFALEKYMYYMYPVIWFVPFLFVVAGILYWKFALKNNRIGTGIAWLLQAGASAFVLSGIHFLSDFLGGGVIVMGFGLLLGLVGCMGVWMNRK